ncbi:hypothetical protein KCU61_g3035, partial [Aureobasidium melanogenum]
MWVEFEVDLRYEKSGKNSGDDGKYERLRPAYIDADLRDAYPQEIHLLSSVGDVQDAIRRTSSLTADERLRSGGHLYSHPSLVNDSSHIDTSNFNRKID